MFGKLRMIMNSGSVMGYFLQALPVALLAGAVYLVVRLCLLKRRRERPRWGTEILRLLFVCYLTGLVSLVVLPANFWLLVYDGLFFGWWDQVGPLFRLGDVNLVPSVVLWLKGGALFGQLGQDHAGGQRGHVRALRVLPAAGHKGTQPRENSPDRRGGPPLLRGFAAALRPQLRRGRPHLQLCGHRHRRRDRVLDPEGGKQEEIVTLRRSLKNFQGLLFFP